MVEGDYANISTPVEAVCAVSKLISSLKHEDIIAVYPNPNYAFSLKNRPISIIHFFTQIHEQEYNEKLFSLFANLLKHRRYPSSVERIVQSLESVIMHRNLYFLLDPKQHYSLLHGDFSNGNIKVNQEDESIKVFDWATFTTGPRFLDMARYFAHNLMPFSKVDEKYLNNQVNNNQLSLIEKIFFLYALILQYILRSGENRVEEKLGECISPAHEKFLELVKQLPVEEYVCIISQQNIENRHAIEKLKGENEQLVKKNVTLEKENQKMRKKITNMITSKSWTITKPLRKMMEWRRKETDKP